MLSSTHARSAKTSLHIVPKRSTTFSYLLLMELDTINLEEVGMDESLTIYENMWEGSALDQSIDMHQAFGVRLFLKSISRR